MAPGGHTDPRPVSPQRRVGDERVSETKHGRDLVSRRQRSFAADVPNRRATPKGRPSVGSTGVERGSEATDVSCVTRESELEAAALTQASSEPRPRAHPSSHHDRVPVATVSATPYTPDDA
jgi:hypothetical protein